MGRLVCVLVALALVCAPASARDGRDGADLLTGTPRADTLHGNGGHDTLRGLGGRDLLSGDTGPDIVLGGNGDDVITGGAGSDALTGGRGADVISGGFGADAIAGSSGDDAISGDNDDDIITGGAGNDVIHGGSGTDKIDGGNGDDVLFNDSGHDVLKGGAGDDELIVDASGRRRASCGPGDDTIIILLAAGESISSRPVNDDCEHSYTSSAPLDPNRGRTELTKDAGQTVTGTPRDDTLLGGRGPDRLSGLAGNDVLWGLRQAGATSSAADVIDGGDGDDTIYGGPGPQALTGGAGDDFVESGLGSNVIDAGDGKDDVRLRGSGPDRVALGAGDDVLRAPGRIPATVSCGPGYDRVLGGPRVRAASDCERVSGGAQRRATARAAAATSEAHAYADAVRATPGLKAYWRLDEARTGSLYAVAHDEVGGAPARVAGRLGAPGATDDGGTSFTPATDHPAFDAALPEMSATSTAELWLRLDDTVDGTVLETTFAPESDYGGRSEIGVAAKGDRLWLSVDGAVRTSLPAARDRWHHVAVTSGPDGSRLIVDGESTTAQAPGYVTHWTAISFEGLTGPVSLAPHALFDELAVYDGAVDPATIEAHRRIGDTGAPPKLTLTYTPQPPVGPGYVAFLFDPGAGGVVGKCSQDGSAPQLCEGADFQNNDTLGIKHWQVVATDRYGRTAPVVTADYEVRASGVAALASIGRGRGALTTVVFSGSAGATGLECTRTLDAQPVQPSARWTPCRSPLTIDTAGTFYVREHLSSRGQPAIPASLPLQGAPFVAFPDLGGDRPFVRYSGLSNPVCRIDGGEAGKCPTELPELGAGMHTYDVSGALSGVPGATRSLHLNIPVAAPSGVPLLSGTQFATVLSRAAVRSHAPPLRFLLSADAHVDVALRAEHGQTLATTVLAAHAGTTNLALPPPMRELARDGRYVIDIAARSATGATQHRTLAFAVLPRRR